MGKGIEELKASIEAIGAAVDKDAEQDAAVVAAVEELLAKVAALPNAADFTEEVTALEAAAAKLTGSNETIQSELDKAKTT